MTQDAYLELERSLQTAQSGVEAAEAHGCLCGALCTDEAFPAAEWAAELLPESADAALATRLVDVLSDVRETTLAALAGGDLEFEPLLPGEETLLEERIHALASWCGGFLYGIGRSGGLGELSDDLAEILHDFSEISRATLAGDDAGEAEENDYVELVEFVRAATQLAYDELALQRSRDAAARNRSH